MPIRLGYVGCGYMAQKVHIPNFAAIPECSLVALAEVRPKLLGKVADRFAIGQRYSSHLEMAEKAKLDAVAISGPFAQQGQWAIEFLKRGIRVFIEKPVATTVADAQAIIRGAGDGGLKPRQGVMVAYMKRYDAGNIVARDTVRELRRSGQLGVPIFARAHGFGGDWNTGLDTPFDNSDEPIPSVADTFQIYPTWLPAKWRDGYIPFLQQYTHNINLLRFLLDAGDHASVKYADFDTEGRLWNAYGLRGIVVLSIAGVRASLETGNMSYHGWDEQTQIYFEHGYVKTSSPTLFLKNTVAEVEIYTAKPAVERKYPLASPACSWSYQREAEAFIDAVAGGKEFDSCIEDTLTDVRLYEEIYQAFLKNIGQL